MQWLRRIVRRDDTIDLDHPMLDLEEMRRLGMQGKAAAHEAIARIKTEHSRVRRVRRLLERRSGLLTQQDARALMKRGGWAEYSIDAQPSDSRSVFGTQLQAIDQWEQDARALWMDLERFVRS